ncbi:hypothetical protein [Streptomyces sp. NPDC054887]
MSDGMRVDLSALDEVIRKLWGLLDDMDKAGGKVTYSTNVPSNAFGSERFLESNDLHLAHEQMKTKIEGLIKGLHGLIDEFGKSASKVRDKYNEQEHANKHGLGGDSGPANKGAYA